LQLLSLSLPLRATPFSLWFFVQKEKDFSICFFFQLGNCSLLLNFAGVYLFFGLRAFPHPRSRGSPFSSFALVNSCPPVRVLAPFLLQKFQPLRNNGKLLFPRFFPFPCPPVPLRFLALFSSIRGLPRFPPPQPPPPKKPIASADKQLPTPPSLGGSVAVFPRSKEDRLGGEGERVLPRSFL